MLGFANEINGLVFFGLIGIDDFLKHPGDLFGGNFVSAARLAGAGFDDLAKGDGFAHGAVIFFKIFGEGLFGESFPATDDPCGVVDFQRTVVVLPQILKAGIDVIFIDGENDDFVIGEEIKANGFGKGDDMELFAKKFFVIHPEESGGFQLGFDFGMIAKDARCGGHVDSFTGPEELGVVNFHEIGFVIVCEF